MNRLEKPARPEFLLDLGRYIRRQQHLGMELEQIAWLWGVSPDVLRLALAFAEAPDWVKLRAMVEDWRLERITEWLRQPDYVAAR